MTKAREISGVEELKEQTKGSGRKRKQRRKILRYESRNDNILSGSN
jgi:hypothetical protein